MDRQLKYLITRKSVTGNVWIALQHFKEMTSLPNRKSYDEGNLHDGFTPSSLRYIYSIYLNESNLIMIFEDKDNLFYLVRNQKVSDELTSEIYRSSKLHLIIARLTRSEKRLLNIPKSLLWKGEEDLSSPRGFDLGYSIERDRDVFHRLTVSLTSLNLKEYQIVTSEMLSELPVNQNITSLILDQNVFLTSFEWLAKFPNLKNITCIHLSQLTCGHVHQICQAVPTLENLTLTHCTSVDLKVFISLLRHSNIKTVWIEDPVFACQSNPYRSLILPETWKHLESKSLRKICVTSDNLTPDVIHDLITSCPNLERFLASKKLLDEKIFPNLIHGDRDDELTFQAFDDLKTGMVVRKVVRIKNLLRDRYEEQRFSDSFIRRLKKIHGCSPQKFI